MRTPDVLDPDLLPEAERCALRLDGDAFTLGLAVVPVDALVDARLRAASLRSAVARYDLVLHSCTSAWVHGVVAALPHPLSLAVDLREGRRTRALRPAPREVRFGERDVETLGGVRVTTPFRTAVDLACLADPFDGEVVRVVRDLLALAGLDAAGAATASLALPRCPRKPVGFARLLSLR